LLLLLLLLVRCAAAVAAGAAVRRLPAALPVAAGAAVSCCSGAAVGDWEGSGLTAEHATAAAAEFVSNKTETNGRAQHAAYTIELPKSNRMLWGRCCDVWVLGTVSCVMLPITSQPQRGVQTKACEQVIRVLSKWLRSSSVSTCVRNSHAAFACAALVASSADPAGYLTETSQSTTIAAHAEIAWLFIYALLALCQQHVVRAN
jgi:hypothetical protein